MDREYNEDEFYENEEEDLDLDYRPLDFDDDSVYDRRLTPSLEDNLNVLLDSLEKNPQEQEEEDSE